MNIIGVPGKMINMSQYGEQIYFKNHVDARAFCKKSNSEYHHKK